MCLNSEIVLAQDEEAQSAAFLPLSSCIMLHIIAVTASSAHSVRGIRVHFLMAEMAFSEPKTGLLRALFAPFHTSKRLFFANYCRQKTGDLSEGWKCKAVFCRVLRKFWLIPKTVKKLLKIEVLCQNRPWRSPKQGVRNANCVGMFFFAKPYHSWERGANENTNGLYRQYIPKGTDIQTLDKDILPTARLMLNTRPRKRLNYISPIQEI